MKRILSRSLISLSILTAVVAYADLAEASNQTKKRERQENNLNNDNGLQQMDLRDDAEENEPDGQVRVKKERLAEKSCAVGLMHLMNPNAVNTQPIAVYNEVNFNSPKFQNVLAQAEAGNLKAVQMIGKYLNNNLVTGITTLEAYQLAFRLINNAARTEDPQCLLMLAYMYQNNRVYGLEHNPQLRGQVTFNLLYRAAKQGYEPALNRLRSAAENGNVIAQKVLHKLQQIEKPIERPQPIQPRAIKSFPAQEVAVPAQNVKRLYLEDEAQLVQQNRLKREENNRSVARFNEYLQTRNADLRADVTQVLDFNPNAKIAKNLNRRNCGLRREIGLGIDTYTITSRLSNKDSELYTFLRPTLEPALTRFAFPIADLQLCLDASMNKPIMINCVQIKKDFALNQQLNNCVATFKVRELVYTSGICPNDSLLSFGNEDMALYHKIEDVRRSDSMKHTPILMTELEKQKINAMAARLLRAAQGIKDENPAELDLPFQLEPTLVSAQTFVRFMSLSLNKALENNYDQPFAPKLIGMNKAYTDLKETIDSSCEVVVKEIKGSLAHRNLLAMKDERFSFMRPAANRADVEDR
jgi:hypothetical protein